MGKQHNKVEKRRRREKYHKRKRVAAKTKKSGTRAAPVPESAAAGTPAGYTAAEPKT